MTTNFWRLSNKNVNHQKLDMHILSSCVLYSTFPLSKKYINVKTGLEIGFNLKWQVKMSVFISLIYNFVRNESLNIKLPSRFRTLSIFCLMSFNMIMNKPLKTDYQHRSGSKMFMQVRLQFLLISMEHILPFSDKLGSICAYLST